MSDGENGNNNNNDGMNGKPLHSNGDQPTPEPRRFKFYNVAIAGLVVMALMLGAWGYLTNGDLDQTRQDQQAFQEQRLDGFDQAYDASGMTREDLIAKIESGRSRIVEAYVLEAYFCMQELPDEKLAWADASSRFENGITVTEITCALEDGSAKRYTVAYNENNGKLIIDGTTPRPGV